MQNNSKTHISTGQDFRTIIINPGVRARERAVMKTFCMSTVHKLYNMLFQLFKITKKISNTYAFSRFWFTYIKQEDSSYFHLPYWKNYVDRRELWVI